MKSRFWGSRIGSFLMPAVLVSLVGVAGSASAMQMNLRDGGAFASQRAVIERDLAGGEKYSELGREDRAQVQASLDRMQQLIEASGSVMLMQPTDQVELFNQQETVNQILTAAARDSRLVCQRERRTGSKFMISSCMTVGERRRQRESSIEALPSGNQTPESVLRDL
ncbi:hypothetical protein FKV24_011400 [Lysobacter maris]|uniref:Uncharacterized protein n=1 Tax=Marilutibacter maris TaxID=1605891 RepID=A0A508AM79_9GAMM|nr:hypothetical protein [Lysobacter maris]KAB8182099.1 hypothetical protein FKV24_011400 [Lysobacter maris]